jgi:hypothetical protein
MYGDASTTLLLPTANVLLVLKHLASLHTVSLPDPASKRELGTLFRREEQLFTLAAGSA